MRNKHLTFEEIKAHRDRTLTAAAALEISDHLVECEECRATLVRLEHEPVSGEQPSTVTYEELADYIDDQLDPPERHAVSEKLARSSQGRRELRDLLEFKREMAAEESGIDFQKWILPIAAGVLIAAAIGWWNFQSKQNEIARNLAPELRVTFEDALANRRFILPEIVKNLHGAQEQLAGQSNRSTSGLRLIRPVGIAVATGTPVFQWGGMANASGYRLTISMHGSEKPSETIDLDGSQVTYVASKPLVPGETYEWEVQALREGQPIAQAPAPPEPEALFYVLGQQQQDEIARQREKFGGSHLALGLVYARAGLIEDAGEQFAALAKEDPELARKLGEALENSRK